MHKRDKQELLAAVEADKARLRNPHLPPLPRRIHPNLRTRAPPPQHRQRLQWPSRLRAPRRHERPHGRLPCGSRRQRQLDARALVGLQRWETHLRPRRGGHEGVHSSVLHRVQLSARAKEVSQRRPYRTRRRAGSGVADGCWIRVAKRARGEEIARLMRSQVGCSLSASARKARCD